MLVCELNISGAYVLELEPRQDARGFFVRAFCKQDLGQIAFDIMQINQSLTKCKATVRGLHFQYPPYAETKIVRCLKGRIFDVILDLRKNSPSFLQWQAVELSEDNFKALYIPKGCAHGFQTLEDECELLYFHDEFYNPSQEGAVNFADPAFGINWPLPVSFISERDAGHKFLAADFKGLEL